MTKNDIWQMRRTYQENHFLIWRFSSSSDHHSTFLRCFVFSGASKQIIKQPDADTAQIVTIKKLCDVEVEVRALEIKILWSQCGSGKFDAQMYSSDEKQDFNKREKYYF